MIPDRYLEDTSEPPDEDEELTDDEKADADDEWRENKIEKEWEHEHFPDDRDQT